MTYSYQPIGKRLLAASLLEELTGVTKAGVVIPESALAQMEKERGNWEPVEILKMGEKVSERFSEGMIVLIPRQSARPKLGDAYLIGEGEIEAICEEIADERSEPSGENLSDLHEGGGI